MIVTHTHMYTQEEETKKEKKKIRAKRVITRTNDSEWDEKKAQNAE